MKKTLSNPTVAMILAVLAVIGTMLLSTRLDFGKKCSRLNDTFYVRTDGEAPIAGSLRGFCSAVEQLVLLGQRYDVDDSEDAYNQAEEVLDLLRKESHDAEEIFEEYSDLLSDTFALESSLTRCEMSEADSSLYAAAQHAAAEAKAAIDSSTYNSDVQRFLKKYGHFPTSTLASLTGVEMPELFA